MLPTLGALAVFGVEVQVLGSLESALGFRGLGVQGFRGLGFRGLGFRGLGFRGLGFRVYLIPRPPKGSES